MADVDIAFLQAQQELLREIRDELRATRSSSNVGSTGSYGGGAHKPGATYTAAQSAADRALSGQWNTLGWAQAYSSTYRGSFTTDVLAQMGLIRAPNTLTQTEFQALAGGSVTNRLGMAALSMIAPSFAAQTGQLADEIYSNSQRFIRFGNNAAGELGVGFGAVASRQIARSIGIEALGDLRLSQADYGTVTSLGMQSGQFNDVRDVDGFRSRVRELANVTGDLTRALHMTVQEVGTAMGNLRQMGVGSIAQQRQVLMQAGGAAMVAGMSTNEMLQAATPVASAGIGMGISASATMPAAFANMAMVRSMSQQGVISQNIIAAGGGAEGIMQSMMGASMGFAGSRAGHLALLGGAGAGGNTFAAMMRGLGTTGGTLGGMLALDMNRLDDMERLGGGADTAFRGMIESRLRMMGVRDMTGQMAQGAAFRMAMDNGMSEAAAVTFARSNFSAEGRRVADQTEMSISRAADVRERQVAFDRYHSRNSMVGRIRSGIAAAEQGFASVVDAGVGLIEGGQGSGLIFGGGFERNLSGVSMGLTPNNMGLLDTARSLGSANGGSVPTQMRFANPVGRGAAALGGLAGGALAFGAINAWNPLGWGSLAIGAAATVAGMAGMTGGSALAGMLGYSDDVVGGPAATQLQKFQLEIDRGNGNAAEAMVMGGKLKGQAWERLTNTMTHRAATAADAQSLMATINQAAQQSGATSQDVINGLKFMGADISMGDAVAFGDGGAMVGKSQLGAMDDLLGADKWTMTGLGDVKATGNLATTANARSVADFIDAKLGRREMTNSIKKNLRDALGSNDAFNQFVENVGATDRNKLSLASEGFRSVEKQTGAGEINRRFTAAMSLAGGKIGIALSAGELSGADAKMLQGELDEARSGKRSILQLLNSGKLGEFARDGAFGDGVLKDVAMLSKFDFDKATSDEISAKFHVSKSDVDAIRADPTTRGSLRDAIGATMLGSSGRAKSEMAQTAGMREAVILERASTILDQIEKRMEKQD